MWENSVMELINNTTKTLKDDLSVEIKQGSKLSIAAACFSIYAFQELKAQLSQIDELRFIFTSPTFVTEKAKKEKREFYIPRLTRERSLYGTEFEIKLRNELTQKAIARECAEWIRQKVTFKSNVSDKSIQGQIVVDGVGYTPINNFTTVELGCEKGNVISTTIVKDESLARTLLANFNEIWNDSKVLQVVTDEVIDSITAAYNENSPDFIYFVTLYNIFNEFLEDVSEDVLPNEATGFKESKIWGILYNFQRDAALAIINKLEKFNGCILADSVGLGKTFTALAVIKYYENRNKSVLVLCPKKLTNNWNTYKDNYVNNPIAADRLRYDVLYHTDLNRTHGTSNGLDLDRLNWGNYDLVVIDESHNFRNGGKLVENPDEDTKDNRYVTLMKKVIRAGVKTKVLMLSATPVNNRFNDLKNQLALAYEGHTDYIDEKLNTTRSIDEIFRNAQRAFNTWSKWEPCDRTTENLLKMLDFDFFEVLDSVTIARSRKHIQKYYDMADIGTFPTRLNTSKTVTGIPDGVVGSHVLALAAHPRFENQKLIFVVVLATIGDAVIDVQRAIRLADHFLILHHIIGYIENRELQKSSQANFVLHSLRDGVAHNPEFIAAFQQFVTHSQTLFPLLRHCVIQILRENRVRRQGNHAAGCRISTVVLCLFLVLFHISPQRGRNIDQPQNNTYLSKLSPSTQQMDGAKVDENCPPATEHSPQTSEFQISRSSSSSKSQALSTSEP